MYKFLCGLARTSPCSTYNKSAADDFGNIKAKPWKIFINDGRIVETS